MIEVFKIIHNLYNIESSPKLLKWEDVSFKTGNRGHTLKLLTQRAKTNIRKNAFPIRVTEPWNSLPETVVQAKSLNTFKNCLDQFWSNQEMLYNFEAPLKTGTGILKLLIDEEEDLIIEESQESCDQNHLTTGRYTGLAVCDATVRIPTGRYTGIGYVHQLNHFYS